MSHVFGIVTRIFGKKFFSGLIIASLAVVCALPRATADSPSDPKRVAFEVVDRNVEQIATVGDVLYYYAEPGMQEYESSKFVKETLENAGFKVEFGGGACRLTSGQRGARANL